MSQQQQQQHHFYEERGALRSGKRYAARNNPYYLSEGELLSHHQKLLENISGPSIRTFHIGNGQGNLLQATVRYRIDYPHILPSLLGIFVGLFREHSESRSEGFEVVITFNAILTNSKNTTFSIFYGHDYRGGNISGARPELKYENTFVVKSITDVNNLPTKFNVEQLLYNHRDAFQSSDVKIHKFLNVIYLVYRFADVRKRERQRRQPM